MMAHEEAGQVMAHNIAHNRILGQHGRLLEFRERNGVCARGSAKQDADVTQCTLTFGSAPEVFPTRA